MLGKWENFIRKIVVPVALALVLANAVCAQDELEVSPIVGVVVEIVGQRIEVELPSGERVTLTTEEHLSEDLIGKKLIGEFAPVADTYVLLNPIFD